MNDVYGKMCLCLVHDNVILAKTAKSSIPHRTSVKVLSPEH